MLKNIISALPEISLLIGILHLWFLFLAKTEKAKVYSAVARFWLLVSLFFSVLYYDKTFTSLLQPNSYTLLFYLLIGFFAYIVLGLSSYWFSAKNRLGCRYDALILLALLCFKLMQETVSLLVLFACYVLLNVMEWSLKGLNYDKKTDPENARLFWITLTIIILFALGLLYLSSQTTAPLSYQTIQTILTTQSDSLPCYLSAVFITIPFLYSLGIVPFHITAEDNAGKSILPVSHYFATIAPIALWGVFIKLNLQVLSPLKADFSPVYVLFALSSVIFGALGVNARINLYRINAYAKTYYLGIMLLLLSYFKAQTTYASFLIGLISVLAFNGMYLVFYSIKSRGEYLATTASLSGLAENKPYTAAILIVSLFSLIGMPPLAGFLAEMNIINGLISQKSYISLGIILFFWLVLAKAGLELIKAAYFEHRLKIYDTENTLLIFYIFLNILCLALVVFNPFNIIETMKDMFYVLYL
ncbi:MAG: hypothetical protein J6B00_01745 [Alphaproteobacteria bacterium]|nr:hypothetical protein [Alphaproteobacteria bacterium]MBP3687584.1 hypothetical protein [Alphaproteobacteria bacterium]